MKFFDNSDALSRVRLLALAAMAGLDAPPRRGPSIHCGSQSTPHTGAAALRLGQAAGSAAPAGPPARAGGSEPAGGSDSAVLLAVGLKPALVAHIVRVLNRLPAPAAARRNVLLPSCSGPTCSGSKPRAVRLQSR